MIATPAKTNNLPNVRENCKAGRTAARPASFVAITLDGIEIRQADGAPFSTPAAAAAALVGILEFAAKLGTAAGTWIARNPEPPEQQ